MVLVSINFRENFTSLYVDNHGLDFCVALLLQLRTGRLEEVI